jgi:hypothetical protein
MFLLNNGSVLKPLENHGIIFLLRKYGNQNMGQSAATDTNLVLWVP